MRLDRFLFSPCSKRYHDFLWCILGIRDRTSHPDRPSHSKPKEPIAPPFLKHPQTPIACFHLETGEVF
jgi:hypothetical protein